MHIYLKVVNREQVINLSENTLDVQQNCEISFITGKFYACLLRSKITMVNGTYSLVSEH